MALSADHLTEWAQPCTEVLVTGLGLYNITGHKDMQPHTAHKKRPCASHECVGWMLSSSGRRQSQCLFCTPTPKCTTSSCCWWMGKNRKRKMGCGRQKEREGDSGRQSVNEWMLLALLFGKNDRFRLCKASQLHIYFSKQGEGGAAENFPERTWP